MHVIAPGESNLSWRDWLLLVIGFILFTIPFIVMAHITMEKISTVISLPPVQSLIEKIEPFAHVIWVALVIINIIVIIIAFYFLFRL